MALLLAVVLILSHVPAASAAEGGECGSGLTWSLEGGTLTISGSGAMDNYTSENLAPWHNLRAQILQVSLPDGLTRIGDRAFYDCYNLSTVTVPGSVEVIGDWTFYQNYSLTMVNLNEGLRSIGESAFEMCETLQEIRVPASVHTIGGFAFYFCRNLTYASIPNSGASIGAGVFTNCEDLLRVDMGVSASSIPKWSFYGCNQLAVVNTQEGAVSASDYKIPNLPYGTKAPVSATQPEITTQTTASGTTTTITQTTTDDTGASNTTTTVVQKTENSTTVSNTTVDPEGSATKTEVTTTVVTPEGWDDVVQQVENAEITQKTTGDADTITVTVYAPQTDTVPKDVIQEFAGKDVELTVQTQSGGQFTLDCEALGQLKVTEDLNLSYSLERVEDVPEMLAGCTVYKLAFHNSASILAQIIIRLPGGHSRQTATLYQIEKDGLNLLQSVMVDDDSNAHWYLKSVDHKTEYLIGMNVPGASTSDAIIPEVLYDEYKVANVYDGVEYVVTGRSSSWGIGLGTVMSILAAVMVSVVVIVGVAMYLMNKRRLAMGYIPELDEEDYM